MGWRTSPTPGIWKKWSMTHIEWSPDASAPSAMRASVGPISASSPHVNDGTCNPMSMAVAPESFRGAAPTPYDRRRPTATRPEGAAPARVAGRRARVDVLSGLGARDRALRPDLLDGDQRLLEVLQPLALLLGDQLDAPGQRVAPAAGHAGVDQRVEHVALRHPQPRHHRDRQRGEQVPLAADLDAPRDLAAVPPLALPGDSHALLPGVLPELLHAALARRLSGCLAGALSRLGVRERPDHEDLLPVVAHLGRPGEPPLGDPARKPPAQLVVLFGHLAPPPLPW